MIKSKSQLFKIAFVFTVLLIVLSVAAGAVEYTFGDVSGNSRVNRDDAARIRDYNVAKADLNEKELKAADVSADGEVNSTDMLLILKYANKSIERFPSGVPDEGGYPQVRLNVKGKTVSLDESTASLRFKFGAPTRIDKSEYGFEWYVYSSSRSSLLYVAVENDRVVGYYTDSSDFRCKGISYGGSASSVSVALGNIETAGRMVGKFDGYNVTFLIDTLNSNKAYGVIVLLSKYTVSEYDSEVLRDFEKQVVDLTNSFRGKRGLDALSVSSGASEAAAVHSRYMAKNDVFSHTDADEENGGDRLTQAGVSWKRWGENISAGQTNAIFAVNGWINSDTHRSHIVDEQFIKTGVGVTTNENSHYIYYYTQLFWS